MYEAIVLIRITILGNHLLCWSGLIEWGEVIQHLYNALNIFFLILKHIGFNGIISIQQMVKTITVFKKLNKKMENFRNSKKKANKNCGNKKCHHQK